MVSIRSLNRAAVLDGGAIAAQAAMARTNMDLFIASPLEFAQSCRVMIGGLATLGIAPAAVEVGKEALPTLSR